MRHISAVIHWLDTNVHWKRFKPRNMGYNPRFLLRIADDGLWRASIIAGNKIVPGLDAFSDHPQEAVDELEQQCARYAVDLGISKKYYPR